MECVFLGALFQSNVLWRTLVVVALQPLTSLAQPRLFLCSRPRILALLALACPACHRFAPTPRLRQCSL